MVHQRRQIIHRSSLDTLLQAACDLPQATSSRRPPGKAARHEFRDQEVGRVLDPNRTVWFSVLAKSVNRGALSTVRSERNFVST